MRKVGRVNLFLVGVAVTSLTLAACTSKSKTTTGTPSGSASTTTSASGAPSSTAASSTPAASSAPAAGDLAPQNTNSTGTPVKGGTLHMLGVGDVDYMDPNITAFTSGIMAARMYSRQLVTYPAVAGKATTDVADLVATIPTAANGG